MELLKKGNIDAVSGQDIQGQVTFYMAIIIGLVIIGIAWFGWTKSSEIGKARERENAVTMQSVLAKREKKNRRGVEGLLLHERELKELETSHQEMSEELSKQKMQADKKLGVKEAEFRKTEEMVQHQSADMEQLKTNLDQEITEKQELNIELATEKFPWEKTEESMHSECGKCIC